MTRKGLFVTGTDTGVGKTVIAALACRLLGADYWKPVEAGGDDSGEAARLADLAPDRVAPPRWRLTQPLSPHEAARRDGVHIDLDGLALPAGVRPLVVEGAGGVLVPLNGRDLMIDLIAHLGLPVLVVARPGLGTINHSLLTLRALAGAGLTVLGVAVNGDGEDHNVQAIERFGRVPVLIRLPRLDPLTAPILARESDRAGPALAARLLP